jgi:hypothetical protein
MLTDVLSDYRADTTVIQELRWVGSGVMQKCDCDLYYSCHDSKNIFGTRFVVSKRISHMLTSFEPLKSRFFNISIIIAHAPTHDNRGGGGDIL